ncbi:MAG: class I SAM-dependent methyltransferase, partial [Cyanobacteria bacterium P01_H01_bin.15]
MLSKEEIIAKTKTVFNAAADHFDDPALSFWNRFGQKIVNRLALQTGDLVLDVCCGTGSSAIPAAHIVGPTGQVLGVDLAESLLALAQEKVRSQNLNNIEFRCADFETLGFPNGSFDAIVCNFGIFFVPDMEAGLRELWRLLRPGGKLALTSWGKQIFEPANRNFLTVLESNWSEFVRKPLPWEQINEPISFRDLLATTGAGEITISTESIIHLLTSPEDWWTIVIGAGYRGMIDQL